MNTAINWDAIPPELKLLPQWIVWREELRNRIQNKTPYQMNGIEAKCDDPKTWTTFDAIRKFDANKFSGVGFVFAGSSMFGIDLDSCIRPDGSLMGWAEDVLKQCPTYAEVSPSGVGVKLIGYGNLNLDESKTGKPFRRGLEAAVEGKNPEIAIWQCRRYFTITGNVFDNLSELTDCQVGITSLWAKLFTEKKANGQSHSDGQSHSKSKSGSDNVKLAVAAMCRMQMQDGLDGSKRLFAAACRCVGYDLADHDSLRAIATYRSLQPFPRDWSDSEILQRVRDAEQVVSRGSEINSQERLLPMSIGELCDTYPDLDPPLIHDVLRQREVCNIIASPKVGKSFLSLNLAWCVATGKPWMGHDVKQGKVLIIDNELRPATLAGRIKHVAHAMGIDRSEYDEAIDVISLRGRLCDIHLLNQHVAAIKAGHYSLVIIDALYRMLPNGTSENDNAAMTAVFNRLDQYAEQLDCAIVCIHHSTKGSQADKSVTDVGAGAGSISRAADTHIIIRPHEVDDHCVMEAVCRSFKSPPPVTITFDWPLWTATTLTPEVKRPARQDKDKQAADDRNAVAAMLAKIPDEPKSIQQTRLWEQFEYGVPKCKRLIGKLVSEGKIKILRRHKRGGSRQLVFYAKTKSDSGCDSGTT